jgi:hypothetical protein
MITSGLIVTLDPDPERAAGVVRDAVLNGPFTPGDLIGRRLVLALEADTPEAAQRWHDWLAARPGVVKVDMAYVQVVEEADHVR